MAKRVLVTGATNIGKAGVATIVYKWGQQFDSNKLVYDYLMQSGLPEQCYQDAIAAKGGIIHTMEGTSGMFEIIKWVEKIVREYHYETIHINSDSAYIAAAYIYAAKKGGIKNIYVHSHCTQIDDNRKLVRLIKTCIHKLCMPYVKRNTQQYLACSKVAGVWMFGNIKSAKKEYKTIYNGVESKRYFYSLESRLEKRKELDLDNYFVFGNIGRLSFQKNQDFLLSVFNEYHKNNPMSKLIIVGEGELKSELKSKIECLHLSESVELLGQREDIPELLSAFDVMVMPSRFEGLPVSMVEAQMASLPCIVSANITSEAKFTDNVVYVDGWDVRSWVECIDKMSSVIRPYDSQYLDKCIFNAKNAALELQDIFLKGNI